MKKRKQSAEVERFYKAWEQADNAQKLLRSALAILEETAGVFTEEEIFPQASYTDGIYIHWEGFDLWGFRDFFSPEDFLNTCNQRKNELQPLGNKKEAWGEEE